MVPSRDPAAEPDRSRDAMTTDSAHLSRPSLRRWLWGWEASRSCAPRIWIRPKARSARRSPSLARRCVRTRTPNTFSTAWRWVTGGAGTGRIRAFEIASVYLDQFPDGDLGRQRVEKYGLRLYPASRKPSPSVPASSAVDGVVIIAEHGDYPTTRRVRNSTRATNGSRSA